MTTRIAKANQESNMVPDALREAIKEYAESYLGEPRRIYEAAMPGRKREVYLSVPTSREEEVMRDVKAGHPSLKVGRIMLETRDQHLARQISDLFFG